jgi:hypothetical protein
LRQQAARLACITLTARSASANLLSQARISVPSCLEKSKFDAICKTALQLELTTQTCDGMRDLAQSRQALGAVTHEETLPFSVDAAVGLQMRIMGKG